MHPIDENQISPLQAALMAMFAAALTIITAALVAWVFQTFGEPGIFALGGAAGLLVLAAAAVTR